MLCYEGLISVSLEIISNDFFFRFFIFACAPLFCMDVFTSPRLPRPDLKSLKNGSEGTSRQAMLLMIIFICAHKQPLFSLLSLRFFRGARRV